MIKRWPEKDPDSNLRYYFDWTEFVADEGSAISAYELAVDSPPDNALVLGANAINGSQVMVWISGGTADATYTVRCRVTLANGTIEDESRLLTVAVH